MTTEELKRIENQGFTLFYVDVTHLHRVRNPADVVEDVNGTRLFISSDYGYLRKAFREMPTGSGNIRLVDGCFNINGNPYPTKSE